MLEGKSFWSAVTCHRFGPWRPAAMLPPGSTCARVSLSTWQRCDRSQRTKAPTGRTHSKEVRGIQHEINPVLVLKRIILPLLPGGLASLMLDIQSGNLGECCTRSAGMKRAVSFQNKRKAKLNC